MGILCNLKEFIFGQKKQNDEIRTAMERINPYKFFQELADYAQSLGFTVGEGCERFWVFFRRTKLCCTWYTV